MPAVPGVVVDGPGEGVVGSSMGIVVGVHVSPSVVVIGGGDGVSISIVVGSSMAVVVSGFIKSQYV